MCTLHTGHGRFNIPSEARGGKVVLIKKKPWVVRNKTMGKQHTHSQTPKEIHTQANCTRKEKNDTVTQTRTRQDISSERCAKPPKNSCECNAIYCS